MSSRSRFSIASVFSHSPRPSCCALPNLLPSTGAFAVTPLPVVRPFTPQPLASPRHHDVVPPRNASAPTVLPSVAPRPNATHDATPWPILSADGQASRENSPLAETDTFSNAMPGMTTPHIIQPNVPRKFFRLTWHRDDSCSRCDLCTAAHTAPADRPC